MALSVSTMSSLMYCLGGFPVAKLGPKVKVSTRSFCNEKWVKFISRGCVFVFLCYCVWFVIVGLVIEFLVQSVV